MTRLPDVTGARVVRALERAGFVVVRVSGSHHRLVHPNDPTKATTVPVHGTKSLRKGTLRNILNQSGVTVEQLIALL
ncbi:MAG: type II toxin-antitoxin system HicA family toxin [Hyphomicrobiaceae bacterium]